MSFGILSASDAECALPSYWLQTYLGVSYRNQSGRDKDSERNPSRTCGEVAEWMQIYYILDSASCPRPSGRQVLGTCNSNTYMNVHEMNLWPMRQWPCRAEHVNCHKVLKCKIQVGTQTHNVLSVNFCLSLDLKWPFKLWPLLGKWPLTVCVPKHGIPMRHRFISQIMKPSTISQWNI